MEKEDVYESDYLEKEEIFADLVNGVLYHGEQVMLAESMAYDRQWKKLRAAHEKERTEKSKKPMTSDEFLSGMRKEDKFIPVITIVIYFGKERA